MFIDRRDPLDPRYPYYNDDGYYFWYSNTGYIVKWCLVLGILLIVIGYVVGGYIHAKRRLKKGLQPLAYHRCLVPRRYYQAPPPPPQQQPYGNYYGPNAYNMNQMPPPMYDPNRPPEYTNPPEGGTKIDPSQTAPNHQQREVPGTSAMPTTDYQPPVGPPPPAAVTGTRYG